MCSDVSGDENIVMIVMKVVEDYFAFVLVFVVVNSVGGGKFRLF